MAYDPAFAYELAVILQDGIRRMYGQDAKEDVFYYITLYNDNYPMLPMPRRCAGRGHPQGPVQGRTGPDHGDGRGEGPPVRQRPDLAASAAGAGDAGGAVRRRRRRLERHQLQGAAPRGASRWNAGTCCTRRRSRERSYVEEVLAAEGEKDVFVAASDFMRSLPEMITRWVPGGLYPLGTDGFGRSETRASLRRHFEVDARVHRRRRPVSTEPEGAGQACRRPGRDPEAGDRSGEDQSDACVNSW